MESATSCVYISGGDYMYAAMSSKGELIYANQLKKGREFNSRWYCPICSQQVILKISSKQKYFFSHLSPCQSQNIQIGRENEESYYHKQAKECFYQALQISEFNVQIEYPLETIKQIADIYIEDLNRKNKRVIEYQHTTIGAKQLHIRHSQYSSQVDRCNWLMDYRLIKNLKKNFSWLQSVLHYQEGIGFYWQGLDTEKGEVVFYKNFPLIWQDGNFTYQEERRKLQDFVEDDLPNAKYSVENSKIVIKTRNRQSLKEIKRLQNNPQYRKQIMSLYQQGIKLFNLPDWIFTENWRILISKGPSWLVFAWVYAIFKQFQGAFTKVKFSQKIQDCIHIQLADSPLIEDNLYPLLADALIFLFEEKGIIRPLDQDLWLYDI